MKRSRFKPKRKSVKVDQRGAIYSLVVEIAASVGAMIIFMWFYYHERESFGFSLVLALVEWIIFKIGRAHV
jgi:hypothetical protein